MRSTSVTSWSLTTGISPSPTASTSTFSGRSPGWKSTRTFFKTTSKIDLLAKYFLLKNIKIFFYYQTRRPCLPGYFDSCGFEPNQGPVGPQCFHLQSQNLQGERVEKLTELLTMIMYQVIDVLSRLAGLWVSPNKDVLYSQV